MSSCISRAFGVSEYQSMHTDDDEFDCPSPRAENDCRETRARAYSFSTEFTDFKALTQNIFNKCQTYIDGSEITAGSDYLLRAGGSFYLGTREKIDEFYSKWQENSKIDASSVARAIGEGLKKVSRPNSNITCVELTDKVQVYPGHMSKKSQKVFERHMLEISMTMEGHLSIDVARGKKIVEIKLREITSAIKKPDHKKEGSYVVFQDKLSISLKHKNPQLYLTYRFPEDKFDHAKHDYTKQKESGINLNLDTGVGGPSVGTTNLGVGYSQTNTNTHTVGLEIDDFQGYMLGNDGWLFKLKQVNDKKEGKVPYVGRSNDDIKDSLLKRRSLWERFTSWSKSKIGILPLPEQATDTLRIPECVKRWECDLDFSERVQFSARIKQHVKFLDADHLNSYSYDFDVPFTLDCARFKFEHELQPDYNKITGLSKKEETELKQCWRDSGPDFMNISCYTLSRVLSYVMRNGFAIETLDLSPFSSKLNETTLEKILGHCPNVHTVILQGCKNLKDLEVFADSKKLKRLELPGISSLLYLSELPHSEALEILNLSNCVNLDSLDGFENLRNLKRLDLSGCSKLNSEKVEALRLALPNTEIIWS